MCGYTVMVEIGNANVQCNGLFVGEVELLGSNSSPAFSYLCHFFGENEKAAFSFERQILQRGTEKVLYPLVHSLNDCNGQSCADSTLGVRSLFRVFQVSSLSQGVGPSAAAFPGLEQRTRL